MDLAHNQAFHLLVSECGLNAGLYRVILNGPYEHTVIVLMKPDDPNFRKPGGRPKSKNPKRLNRPKQPQLMGQLKWVRKTDLMQLLADHSVVPIELKLPSKYHEQDEPLRHNEEYQHRCEVMASFLDYVRLEESLLVHRGLGGLIRDAMDRHGVSERHVRDLWSLLCVLGLTTKSLLLGYDRCGAPGEKRYVDEGGTRKKSGRKTQAQRIHHKYFGCWGEPMQPGMSKAWSDIIIAVDKRQPTPKKSMRERYDRIIKDGFSKKYCFNEKGDIEVVPPLPGEYPSKTQVKRVLTEEVQWLEKILQKTSAGHFQRSLRGLSGVSWQDAAGPGHVYAIDSTIGDIYLRSSINPAWIIGRPIVYVIVDVWSTAVVGFYVCLSGPSWTTARISLLNIVAPTQVMATLWNYAMRQSLDPLPTIPYRLMCDRGEYLSIAAKATGADVTMNLSYAPPFRPDLKGVVEVMHRIMKDVQYNFMPGAMDARRKEYDLRRSNPSEATMTVQHYMHFLSECFFRYNLTADRKKRVDAHMIADGVYPSPAGLWRWGHAVGIGYRKVVPFVESVSRLLPAEAAWITKRGVCFDGDYYSCPEAEQEQWSTYARNHGVQRITAYPYPGSNSLIWTPNRSGDGMLELAISDHSLAAPGLTRDEKADAFAYQLLQSADINHQAVVESVKALQRMDNIKARAAKQTQDALAQTRGPVPTIKEARAMEKGIAAASDLGSAGICGTPEVRSEAQQCHEEMMTDIYSQMNAAPHEITS
ncbi:DDE-type integrase/transposase/recombinase [Acidovorax sp. LjRoot118]|uniref:DDE-type integrase/transposase/recombinase n=1 Tax=unclassified Acidovorax TaxID=2684926 RepID=UPI00070E45C6|nr:DDE-type integrase/transposase/recombinase [Acidovorax sp. Root217]KRC24851.1 hypothetical protein ASE31_20515 [Acidovorax sp. Root217]